ncbi:MAG: hypothetical protein KF810_17080 [Rhizobiaceae bacterium]|nr:hypothetical protein [Rhizobiaceae bacterium]
MSLLSRVAKLEGADREVDAEIDVHLFGGETVWKMAIYTMESYPASRRPSKQHIGGFANEYVPLYTSSLDAAVALVERVRPGCDWQVSNGHEDGCAARIDYGERATFHAGHTPAIALILALLQSLDMEPSDA